MKLIAWFTALMLTGLLALPVLAQRNGMGRPGNREAGSRMPMPPFPSRGRVLSIDLDRMTARVSLAVRIDDANAPGKIPELIARMAAQLAASIDRMTQQIALLEEQGRDVEAEKLANFLPRLREKVDETRHWRDIETVTAPDTQIHGWLKSPVATIPAGTMVRFLGSVDGKVDPAVKPEEVALVTDINKVEMPRTPENMLPIKPPPVMPDTRGKHGDPPAQKTFFFVVGRIATVDPFVVRVNGADVRVINPAKRMYLHREALALKDLQPNSLIRYAEIESDGKTVTRVKSIVVNTFPDEPEISPPPPHGEE